MFPRVAITIDAGGAEEIAPENRRPLTRRINSAGLGNIRQNRNIYGLLLYVYIEREGERDVVVIFVLVAIYLYIKK